MSANASLVACQSSSQAKSVAFADALRHTACSAMLLQSQDDKYLQFYEQFGRNLKMGITEDNANRR